MLGDRVEGPGVVKMEKEERERTTLRPGVSKLNRGSLPPSLLPEKAEAKLLFGGPYVLGVGS